MKKFFCFGLMFLLMVGLAACNNRQGEILWQVEVGEINSNPALSPDGKIIYVTANKAEYVTDKSVLYAINSKGKKEWSFELDYDYSNPLVGEDGTVYIIDDQGVNSRLYALNKDGSKKWSFAIGNVTSNPAIGKDGTIYINNYESFDGLYAINPDGSKKWNFKMKTGHSSPAIAKDGTIYVINYYGLYAINPDGSEKWEWEYPYKDYLSDGIYSSPAIGEDGTIYVGSHEEKLYAINPDGTEKWSFDSKGKINSSPVIGEDDSIYIGSELGFFYAVAPDGTEKWNIKLEGTVNSSPIVGADGTVYVGSGINNSNEEQAEVKKNGRIYAINPDGTEKWSTTTGYISFSSGVISKEGILYIGSLEGDLYAIKGGSSGVADSAWPMYGHDPARSGSSYHNNKAVKKEVIDEDKSINVDSKRDESIVKEKLPANFNNTMFGGDYFNTLVYKTVGVKNNPGLKWKFDKEDIFEPTITNGIAYFGSEDGNLYAVDIKTGQEKWRFKTSDYITGTPAVVDKTVYFGSHNGILYALNVDTGKEKWQLKISGGIADSPGGGIASSPKVKDGVIYFGNYDKCIYAVDIKKRKIKWKYETESFVLDSPAIEKETIYIANDDGYLYALDIETGRLKWRRWGISTLPAIADGIIYFGNSFGEQDYFYAIDAETGQKIWEIEVEALSSTLAVFDGVVYFTTTDQLLAVDAKTGVQKRAYKNKSTLKDYQSWFGPLAIADGIIYLGNANYLKAISIKDWTQLWDFALDDIIYSGPVVANGVIYCTGYSNLYAIGKSKIAVPEMVSVAGGSCQYERYGETKTTRISDLRISKYEVKNKEFVDFLNSVDIAADGSYHGKKVIAVNVPESQIKYKKGKFVVEEGKENYPVVYVTYYGALVYCNWLSETTGLHKAYIETGFDGMLEIYDEHGYRLPTEEEWEYIVKNGEDIEPYANSGSIKLDDIAWYWTNATNPANKMYKERGTHLVGQKRSNKFGIYDLRGNVWEWCYNSVLRGGSWGSSANSCQIYSRKEEEADAASCYYGLRIVRTM